MVLGESDHRRKTTLYADLHQESVQRRRSLVVLLKDQQCESFSESFPPASNHKTYLKLFCIQTILYSYTK